jgi:hypothetical protein
VRENMLQGFNLRSRQFLYAKTPAFAHRYKIA